MNLLDKYLQLSNRIFFRKSDLATQAKEALETIQSIYLKPQLVYLSDEDPVNFVLYFLALLDQGFTPVCLAPTQTTPLESTSLVNGKFKIGTKDQKPLGQEAQYAVPTSGTTGTPKLCYFSLEKALELAKAHAEGFQLSTEFEITQTLPVHHSYGIIAYILTPLVIGTPVNFSQGLIGLRKFLKEDENLKSVLHVSPSQARFILREKKAAPQIRKLSIGGGSLALSEVAELQSLLPEAEIYVSYGLTEAGPRVTAGLYQPQHLGLAGIDTKAHWIGHAIPGVQLGVLDDEIKPEGKGKLCVKSSFLKLNTQQDEMIQDWLITRDFVSLNSGEVFFISREDDLLKFGGVTIYPRDIEEVVRYWPGVKDVIVLKKFDPVYEERPLLCVEGSITQEEAQKRLQQDFSQMTALEEVFVLRSFPRQSLEKVDRKKLKEMIGITE